MTTSIKAETQKFPNQEHRYYFNVEFQHSEEKSILHAVYFAKPKIKIIAYKN